MLSLMLALQPAYDDMFTRSSLRLHPSCRPLPAFCRVSSAALMPSLHPQHIPCEPAKPTPPPMDNPAVEGAPEFPDGLPPVCHLHLGDVLQGRPRLRSSRASHDRRWRSATTQLSTTCLCAPAPGGCRVPGARAAR